MIASFAHMLKIKNSGSIAEFKVNYDGRFRYFFMAFSACIFGWQHCRPVISVDGTHMKNKYAGTLITASTTDANDQIFPLAFCFVDSENDSAWQWFFNQLKQIIVERRDLVIVSNRHKSIGKGIQIIFPNAHHCICMVHLLKNLKLTYKSKIIDNIFYPCAKAYNVVDFEFQMRQLEVGARGIRNELMNIGLSRWCRAFSPCRRYKMMTTNISESLNAAIKEARELPIASMLEVLRMMLQRWFYERRNEAAFQATDFTKSTEMHLREQIDMGRSMQVNPVDNMQYQVIDETKQYDVHLSSKRCSCRIWDSLQISCSHACAVLTTKHISIKEYISPYYLNSTLSSIYSRLIHPLGHEATWNIPKEVKNIIILPPNVKRSTGRPKKIRIPSQMEFKRRIKCGRCGRVGHNRKSCKYALTQ